jgi:major membrane immunogen (membrane-anchored lipoprotein)
MKKLLFAFVMCMSIVLVSCGSGAVTSVSDNDSIDTVSYDTIDTIVLDTVGVDTTICID